MKTKTGLWQTKSQKGDNYYKGKIKIGDKEYSIALFKNNKKQESSPDLMLYVEEKEKKEQEKKSYTIDEIVNSEEFAKGTENIQDDDIAF